MDGRDIGWAEMVTVELAICYLCALSISNSKVLIWSDNQGVIGALGSGYSCNPQQNHVLTCITGLFGASGLWVTMRYVVSKDDLADGLSCGVFPHFAKLPSLFSLPFSLSPFLHQA